MRKSALTDLFCAAGLSMIAAGLWMNDPSVALCVVGGLLLAGGVWGTVR